MESISLAFALSTLFGVKLQVCPVTKNINKCFTIVVEQENTVPQNMCAHIYYTVVGIEHFKNKYIKILNILFVLYI
jgi:hypothetical protein